MESTKLLQAIEALRGQLQKEKPLSDMEIVRHATLSMLAKAHQVEMPPLLSTEQRQVFLRNIDHVAEFLQTQDGADAVELLVNAFVCFTEYKNKSVGQVQDEEEEEVEGEEEEEDEDYRG